MKKIRFLIITLILSCIVLLPAFAEEPPVVSSEGVTKMSLSEAVDFALKNNTTIIDLVRQEEKQEDTYEDAKKIYRKWQSKQGYCFETANDYLEYNGYAVDLAEATYNNFLINEEAAKKTVEYQIKTLVCTINETEDSKRLLNKTIENQKNLVKVSELKLKLNIGKEIDLTNAKNTLAGYEVQLDTLNNTINTLKNNLKILMGFSVTSELEIEMPTYEYKLLTVDNLSDLIEESLTSNKEVSAAKLIYKQKEINNALAKAYWLDKDSSDDARIAYTDAEKRLNDTINNISKNLEGLYNDVKSSESSVEVAKEALDKTNLTYLQARIMYQIGLINKNTFDNYEVSKITSQNAYNKSLSANYLLNERWNIALCVGDVVAN